MKTAPTPPTPPDPKTVAQAQTGSNITTGVANTIMGNANVVGPYGSSSNAISNYQTVTDPDSGKSYQIPQYTQTNTLSPEQQQLYNQQTQLGGQLNQLAIDQTGRLSGLLGSPIDTSTLSSRGQMPTSGPQLMGYSSGAPISTNTPLQMATFGVNRAPIQTSLPMQNQSGQIGDAGGISRGFNLNNQSGQIGDAGGISRGVNLQNQSGQVGDAGAVSRGVSLQNQSGRIGDAGALSRNVNLQNQSGQIGDAGAISRNVNLQNQSGSFGPTSTNVQTGIGPQDWSQDRTKVENALYSRINPQLDRDREALESTLTNQGYQRGTQAFDEAMNQFGRQANDARNQVTLAGGQEQSRLAGLALNQGQFANQAQAQEYAQQQGRGEFSNAATAANNQARLAENQFYNQAQQQQFGQNVTGTQMSDAATAANNQARLTEGQFYNATQQQQFAQNQAAQQAADAATASNNQARLAEGQFYNQAQQQQFGQNVTGTQLADAATAANNQARIAEGTFANTAQGQQFAQNQAGQQAADAATAANNQARIAENTFTNAAQQQQFGQNVTATQAANAATEANNRTRLAEGTFGRESQAQGFTQDMANAQMFNAAAQQNNAANLASNQFYNQAQQQGFDQGMATGQANNAVAQQQFGNNLQIMGAQDARRQAEMQEMLSLRNQPINEITALMGGGQVSTPQFSQYQAGNISGTPVGEYYYQSDAAKRANYQSDLQYQQAQMQGMYGVAGSVMGAGIRYSDRRLKRDVVDLGVSLLNGIKLYAYRLLGDAVTQVGVMADEVFHVKPDAVYLTPSGFLAVDYGEIF